MFFPIIFIIFCVTVNAQDVTVTLPNYGDLIGLTEKSRDETDYFAFRGIPYGKEPTGDLRFQDVQRPEPWGSREAKLFGSKCSQVHPFDRERTIGDENCLFVNVYTKSLQPDAKLPVIIWIHPGAFLIGAGSSFEPHFFMDKPLILVTFNYRIGVFGFMHLDDKFLSGNYGMKDQVEVMKWVQENIEFFGGDRKKVTLAGSSAGASSVHWHMYSPLSKGLFQRAILQSAQPRGRSSVPRHVAKLRAEAIATMAGCVYKSTEENVKCLRRIPMAELIKFQLRFEIWKGNPICFGVVIESETSENPFITISPYNSDPHTEEMPILIGFTADEGGYISKGLVENQGAALQELGEKYERLFPILMGYQFNIGLEKEQDVFKVTDKIRRRYFGNAEINKSTFPRIKQMLADSLIKYDAYVTLKLHEGPRYFYIYSHRNQHTFAELENDFLDASGPVHSDDLISLFKLINVFRTANDLNEIDLKVSKLMINLWAGFIIDGNPNYGNNYELEWQPVQDELSFYSIDVEPKIGTLSWENHYWFWERLRWHLEV